MKLPLPFMSAVVAALVSQAGTGADLRFDRRLQLFRLASPVLSPARYVLCVM